MLLLEGAAQDKAAVLQDLSLDISEGCTYIPLPLRGLEQSKAHSCQEAAHPRGSLGLLDMPEEGRDEAQEREGKERKEDQGCEGW